MEKKNALLGVIIIAFLITLVLVAATFTELYVGREIPFQIVAAFISVAMMGVVTWVLLRGQRIVEEEKDKNIRMFQKKLKIYAKFNQALWECINEEKLIELRNKCMYELVMILPYERMEKITEFLEKLSKNVSDERSNNVKSDITAVLKDDILEDVNLLEGKFPQKELGNKEENLVEEKEERENEAHFSRPSTGHGELIVRLDKALRVEYISDIKEDEKIKKQKEIKTEADSVSFGLKNGTLQGIWNSYTEGKKQCWHFAAWDNGKQHEALHAGDGTPILSLMEYDEDWRTTRLKQVKEGDILFLFNRGGTGYVGMYKAVGNFIIHNLGESGVAVEERRQGEEPKRMEYKELPDDMRKYDIYGAYEDDATYISNVIVEKIKELDGDTYNPISVIRQTIARLSKDNVEALLKYFDDKETVRNN